MDEKEILKWAEEKAKDIFTEYDNFYGALRRGFVTGIAHFLKSDFAEQSPISPVELVNGEMNLVEIEEKLKQFYTSGANRPSKSYGRSIIHSVIRAAFNAQRKLNTHESSPRLQEAAEWVRVEDGLPEFGANVLVIIDGVVRLGKFTGAGWYLFETIGIYSMSGDQTATHWRPLPTPPKPNNE